MTQGLNVGNGDPGEPPALSLPESGPLPSPHYYRVDAHGFAEKEGANENASIGLGATIGSSVYPVEFVDYSRHGDAEGTKSFTGFVTGTGPLNVVFTEYDNNSKDDRLLFDGMLNDATGIISGSCRGISNSITRDCNPVVDFSLGAEQKIEWSGNNHKDFWVSFTVNKVEQTAPEGAVRLCVYWPTHYWDSVDEGIKGLEIPGSSLRAIPASFAKYFLTIVSAFEETHPTLPAAGELNGDPSEYKYLDKDGCIPEGDALRIAQLAYFPTDSSGNMIAGTDLFLKIVADYAIPSSAAGEYARYLVYSKGDVKTEMVADGARSRKLNVWPPEPVSMSFHLRHFGPGSAGSPPSDWTPNAEGLLVPPSQINVTGTTHNDASNVAGTVSRMLAQLDAEDAQLPAGNYPVEISSAEDARGGTPDYSCRRIGDSHFSTGATAYTEDLTDPYPAGRVPAAQMGVEIGGPLFPCAYDKLYECRACRDNSECQPDPQNGDREEGVCRDGLCTLRLSSLTGANDCRKMCSAANPDCPGGQSCYKEQFVTEDDQQPGEQRAYPQRYCADGDSCFCGWDSQGGSKTSNAHELGHLVQASLSGKNEGGEYKFPCPANQTKEQCGQFGPVVTVKSNLFLNDPPGTVAACKCDKVSAAGRGHCLQSLELTTSAQAEGYGHFFAAMLWNNKDNACWFNYYKEFLNDDGTVTPPPVAKRCDQRVAWRDQHMCGVFDPNLPATTAAALDPTNMSTEYDWMNFLTELKRTDTIGFSGIIDIYRRTCHPENVPGNPICTDGQEVLVDACYKPDLSCDDSIVVEQNVIGDLGVVSNISSKGRPIYWRDGRTGNQFTDGGFYDGAVRIWGAADVGGRPQLVRLLGDAHAVSDGSEP